MDFHFSHLLPLKNIKTILLENFMRHFLLSSLVYSLCTYSATHLHASNPIDVSNACNAMFPEANDSNSENLAGLCYEAVDAANKNQVDRCRSLLFSIKREVERIMRAQVKFEAFIDDAFVQAEAQGGRFSDREKKNIKKSFGISSKGSEDYDRVLLEIYPQNDPEEILANCMRYQVYEEQPYYNPPPRLNAGLSLVIIGGLLMVVPNPICIGAGKWTLGLGVGMMVESCVQGCERQEQKSVDIRQNHYR